MFGKKINNALLCLDLGTASVKSGVFEDENGQIKLKGFSSVPQEKGNIQSGNIIYLEKILRNVKESVKKSENSAKMSPQNLVIGLSGEMVKGMSVKLQYARANADKRITAQELKTIIYELQWQAFDIIREQISDEMSIPEIDLKLVNASIVSIRVDSEDVDDPRGMPGELIEMEIFNCFASIQHFGQIQNIAVELPYHQLKGIFIQSFAICHSLALRNPLESSVVIDIGAGTTDICVLLDGKIVGNRSFAFGGNSLSKRISHDLSTSFEEAEMIKFNYADNTLDNQSKKVVHEVLQSDIEIWISSLEFCLKELPLKSLPEKFLLCGLSSLLEEFSTAILGHDWKQHFPMANDIQVRHIEYSDIVPGDFSSEQLNPEFIPLVAVAYATFDLLYNNQSIEAILNAIIADKGV